MIDYITTQALIEKCAIMEHDHFDVYDPYKSRQVFMCDIAKKAIQKKAPMQVVADFIDNTGGQFCVESRPANSTNARKTVSFVQSADLFELDKKNKKQEQPKIIQGGNSGYSKTDVDQMVMNEINAFKKEIEINDLKRQLENKDDKREQTHEIFMMAASAIKSAFMNNKTAPINGVEVNDVGYEKSEFVNGIDEAYIVLEDKFGKGTLIKLAQKLESGNHLEMVDMVKNWANSN